MQKPRLPFSTSILAPAFLLSTLLATILPGLRAQDEAMAMEEMAPAKEVQKLHRMLGNWQGTGTVTMAPGMPEQEWTSTSKVVLAMGGHFVREDTRIEFGKTMPSALVFRTFWGWDKSTKRYMSYAISNMGKAMESQVHWLDDDTMLGANTMVEDGKVVIERWTTKFGKDSYEFVGHQAIGAGAFKVHVQGSFKKVTAKIATAGDVTADNAAGIVKAKAVDAGFFMGAPAKEMGRLEKMVGKYRFKGHMIPVPGAPKMEISGHETFELIFGGSVLEMKVTGDPIQGMTYEGWGAIAWDSQNGCYQSIWVSNMGEAMVEEARWVGETDLVSTSSFLAYGQPSAHRTVLRCNEDGSIGLVTEDAIIATNKPVENFRITYEKQK